MIFVGTRDGLLIGYGLTSSTNLFADDVDFGTTQVGTSSTRYATVRATSATVINSLAISGSAYSLGSKAPTFPKSLAAGRSLTIPLSFSPTAIGLNTGQLTINSDSGSVTTSLTGFESSSVNFASTPSTVDFGRQPVEGPAVSKVVKIKNQTGYPATIYKVDQSNVSSVFTLSRIPTSKTLSARATMSFTVTFHPPSSSGNYANDYPSLVTVRTSLGNVGIPFFATAAPTSNLALTATTLAFPTVKVGHQATLTFHLLNNGGMPLIIRKVANLKAPFSMNTPIRVGTTFGPNEM